MKRINVHKVVINIGVGRSGEPIDKAKNALLELTGQRPAVRGAKNTVRDFGIHKGEPIDIPGTKYNPDIGIFGMDVNIVLNRPGYRIAKKSRKSAKIGKTHRINREEAVKFFKQEYGVEVE